MNYLDHICELYEQNEENKRGMENLCLVNGYSYDRKLGMLSWCNVVFNRELHNYAASLTDEQKIECWMILNDLEGYTLVASYQYALYGTFKAILWDNMDDSNKTAIGIMS